MDAKRKESMSIMKKIMIAMATGILLGVVCLWLRESLTAGGNEGTWKLINRIFFQDITQEKGFYSLGLFYIIQQLFMRGLQLAIVPLVLSSLSLALCSMADPKRLGKIAGKTIGTFVGFYVCGATLAGLFAYFIKSMGWFSVNLPETTTSNVATLEAYNPLTTVINAVPSNVVEVLGSNNSILAVVVVAVILGLSMNALGDKAATIKSLLQNLNDIVQVYMDIFDQQGQSDCDLLYVSQNICNLWNRIYQTNVNIYDRNDLYQFSIGCNDLSNWYLPLNWLKSIQVCKEDF